MRQTEVTAYNHRAALAANPRPLRTHLSCPACIAQNIRNT